MINRVENDSMIKDARAMRENEEYDPYTTIEKGSLIAPDISLSGKISKSVNNGEEIYLFYSHSQISKQELLFGIEM